jgi:hypothetical protein
MECSLVTDDLCGGMPEAETEFRYQLVITRMKKPQRRFSGWYIRCVLYSLYDIRGVNS